MNGATQIEAGAPGLCLSVGAGRESTSSRIVPLKPSAAALAAALRALPGGREGWFAFHRWSVGRKSENWQRASGTIVDLDHHMHDPTGAKPKGIKAPPPPAWRDKLQALVESGGLPGNVFHHTANGERVYLLFGEVVTDEATYRRAYHGACAVVRTALVGAGVPLSANPGDGKGYEVDPSVEDLAQWFWSPRALVDGQKRNGVPVVLREQPYSPAELAMAAPPVIEAAKPEEEKGYGKFARAYAAKVVKNGSVYPTLIAAREAFNRDHAQDWGTPGKGQCPACGHKKCFGRLPDVPAKWCCHSSNHVESVGQPCPNDPTKWFGDALDLAAHAAGESTIDHLRSQEYLARERRDDDDDSPDAKHQRRPPSTPTARPPATEALTDSGNAERLVRRHGPDLHYCHPWAKWLTWDDTRWKLDDTAQVERFAKAAVRGIPGEAADEEDGDRRSKVLAHAVRSEQAPRRQAMISLAKAEPTIPVLPEDLDADQMLLNVRNGTIDLRTGQKREHRREDLITKLAPVEFDPGAKSPKWDRFLDRIMDGNLDLIAYLQRAAGYALTGDVTAHALFFAHGGGANGKSTFLNTLMRLLGDYAVKAPAEILLAKRGERHPTDMTMLHGARLAVCHEVNEGRRFDLAAVKGLTGGDPITARRMREDFWTFQPTAKPWLATNSRPRVPESDEATWRRIQLIPFEVTIPEPERDAALGEKLALELPGILLWALDGCRKWLEKGGGLKGLALPDAVRAATSSYRQQEDSIGAFLDEECVLVTGAKTGKPQLYAAFVHWCEQNSEATISKHDFNARIGRMPGVDGKSHSGGARVWKGIALKASPTQTEMHEEARA